MSRYSKARKSPFLLACVVLLLLGQTAGAQDFIATAVGDFDGVAVVEVEGDFDSELPDAMSRRAMVMQAYYEQHGDDLDFVYVFTNFDYEMPTVTLANQQTKALAYYIGAQNQISGIGKPLFDNTWIFGSQGRLQGYVDAGNVDRLVTSPYEAAFSDTMNLLSHELLHRFGAYVSFLEDGTPSDKLLGSTDLGGETRSHWSFLFDSGGSTHYGNRWQDNGDGTFSSLPKNRYFGPLDLYLMGLADASEVPPMLLIDNPEVDRERMPEPYVTIEGIPQIVTIEDIIAAEGPRIPGVDQAQKSFRVGFVLVTRPGEFSGHEIAALNAVASQWTLWFSALTKGMAQIDVGVVTPSDLAENPGADNPTSDPRTTPPEIQHGVEWLLAAQESDGNWQDSILSQERDTAESIMALERFAETEISIENAKAWLTGRSLGVAPLTRRNHAASATENDRVVNRDV